MKTRTVLRVLQLIIMLIVAISCSKVPKFDHYGVYIMQKNDFIEIKNYNWNNANGIYQYSRNFDTTPILFENELEIYVYSAKAKLNDYRLIMPMEKNRNGDFVCSNSEYGHNYYETEITVEPIEKRDDLIIIRSKNNGGTFILHIEDNSEGFIFTSQNIIIDDEIKQTISNWIILLNNSNYAEFLESYHPQSKIEDMKKDNEFVNTLKEIEKYKIDLINELETMLNENLTYYLDYVFFNSTNSTFIKDNGKWFKVYDLDECYEKVSSNIQAVIGDLNNLAASALAFYKIPARHGGGGRSWSSNVDNVGSWLGDYYNASTKKLTTKNGSFYLSINRDVLTIVGTGNELGNDGSTNVKATISVTGATSGITTIINN